MAYDLNVLPPDEFEELSRDLLQKLFNVFIESFTTGKDGGIDLRCTSFPIEKDSQSSKGLCIIQAKRYKDFNTLLSNLKKEVVKVRKLNPTRYIIITSVGLTPDNKNSIKNLFGNYITSTDDIFGRNDIDNLLTQFPEVVESHYKLWLASTDVLKNIVKKEAINWSNFELEDIKDRIRVYVPNSSFDNAMKIINEHRYVVISGIPGIGKTMLASMLAFNLLANGFEQFISIPGSLDNALKLFEKGKKQVFFFDDFLGSNVFQPTDNSFDRNLITFINAIKRDPDKVLIMTTREYILSDARIYYEKLDNSNIDLVKCIIDISSYTRQIKAKILYNHIAQSELPQEYITELISDRKYLKLIEHRNFNPRIIETYIDNGQWREVPANEFVKRFIGFFDDPASVWNFAFKKLTPLAQYALFVLATMGGNTRLSYWRKAAENFCNVNPTLQLILTDDSWHDMLKVLHDCFIRTMRDKNGDNFVEFFNPSVRDFLANKISESPGVQHSLISAIIYPNQVVALLRTNDVYDAYSRKSALVTDENFHLLKSKFKEFMKADVLYDCRLVPYNPRKQSINKATFAYDFMLQNYKYGDEIFSENEDKLIDILTDYEQWDFIDRVKLFNRIYYMLDNDQRDSMLQKFDKEATCAEDYLHYIRTLNLLGLKSRFNNDDFFYSMEKVILNDYEAGFGGADEFYEQMGMCDELIEYFDGYSFSTLNAYLQDFEEQFESVLKKDNDWFNSWEVKNETENQEIHQLMLSLIE